MRRLTINGKGKVEQGTFPQEGETMHTSETLKPAACWCWRAAEEAHRRGLRALGNGDWQRARRWEEEENRLDRMADSLRALS